MELLGGGLHERRNEVATIHVGETDFDALADAANIAMRNGYPELAKKLDWIARKTSAALSNRNNPTLQTRMGRQSSGIKAADVPSTLAT